jgi:hypothetical protein
MLRHRETFRIRLWATTDWRISIDNPSLNPRFCASLYVGITNVA